MISIALLSGGARAQDAPQTVDLVKVDVQKLAAGYRSPKVVGMMHTIRFCRWCRVSKYPGLSSFRVYHASLLTC